MIFLEERTIGPELGQDSIDAGKLASIVGYAAVAVFMIASYGFFGTLAVVALALNMAMIFAVLSMIGATLTLPGIAGIVLTMGMAVDANVLIYERIREELRRGNGPARAIEIGYEKAMSAIIDSNATTLISTTILFFVGSGPVKGFCSHADDRYCHLGLLGHLCHASSGQHLVRLAATEDHCGLRGNIMAFRLKLVPEKTEWDFFRWASLTFGASVVGIVASIILVAVVGLEFWYRLQGRHHDSH